jgi:hypothetical protein
VNACTNCGTPSSPDNPTPSHCGECPPWICDGCDVLTSMADPCACWISFEGMALADIKGLLALGDLSVDP